MMISALATHCGLVRQNNEDCLRSDDNLGIYLLADGIGGHSAGEIASAVAVDTVYAALSSSIADSATDALFVLMAKALQDAHWAINTKARTSLSFMGMGTTLVVAVLRKNTAYIAHAGDSRAYHFSSFPLIGESQRRGDLKQLTHDHTMGDQLLANGVPKEQIPANQFHNLTQAVGCGAVPIPDFSTVELNRGDMLLLCTDGLTDMLTDSEIEAILANGDASLDALAENLIDAANAKGGRDNVSVVLVKSL